MTIDPWKPSNNRRRMQVETIRADIELTGTIEQPFRLRIEDHRDYHAKSVYLVDELFETATAAQRRAEQFYLDYYTELLNSLRTALTKGAAE